MKMYLIMLVVSMLLPMRVSAQTFTMGKPIHSLLYMYYISSFLAPVIKTTLQGSGEVFGSVELCCRNQKNIVQ